MTRPLWLFFRMTLFFTLLWTLLVILTIDDGRTDAIVPFHNRCATHILKYEKQNAIPRGLLHAISKVESGRIDNTGRIVSWPWTIHAEGQGHFYPTKKAAVMAAKAMQAKGIKNIDVGCMQINLYYHSKAFKTLADAFEPKKNVAYAAQILTNHKKNHKSWFRAVAYYHSANANHNVAYQKSVFRVWNQDKRRVSLAAGKFFLKGSKRKKSHMIKCLASRKPL
jgi:hypothetical protein